MAGPNLGVAWIYRALGAKIGKRVFFPGSGLRVLEYDLLEVLTRPSVCT